MAPFTDPIAPGAQTPITVLVDGAAVPGFAGQTVAGILLGQGRLAWRRTGLGHPRGVFCGIGVCYDCLVTVNGLADVRACQRRATDGDVVTLQTDAHPGKQW
jgi:hypothetical protein